MYCAPSVHVHPPQKSPFVVMTDLMAFKSFHYFDREVDVSFVAAVGKEHKENL